MVYEPRSYFLGRISNLTRKQHEPQRRPNHGRSEITEAVTKQMATMDYSPAFQFGHPLSFALANKLKELTPAGLDYVFFTGSGSESADTSLKICLLYTSPSPRD